MARKVIIYAVLAVVAVNAVIIALVLAGGAGPAPRPLPNPNGYDDFVKAGKMIPQGYSYAYKTMSRENLAALVASNAAALKLVREGLTKQCRVPNDYSRGYAMWLVTNLMQMKGLALDLCAEGRLNALEGNANGAVASYLDAIRFGQESGRGGVMIVKLTGDASENSAAEDLVATINELNEHECTEVVHALEALDEKEEPVEENLWQEDKWAHQSATSLREKINQLLEYRTSRQMKGFFVETFHTNVLRRRRMEIEFAARAYELEKGKRPQSAADLVPDYLKAIPKDPVTGKEMGLGQ